MNFVVIAILAHFFWALVNIGDKYIIVNKIKDPLVYLFWLSVFSGLAIGIIPFIDFYIPNIFTIFLLLIAGILAILGTIYYFKAVSIEDITRINIWWSLIPIFTLIVGWAAIGERLNLSQGLAFILLVAGAVLASFHIGLKKIKFSKAFWLMVISCFFYAINAIIFRYVTQDINFLLAFVWVTIFIAILSFSFFLSAAFRRNFFSKENKIDIILGEKLFFISVVDNLGGLMNIWALSLGPAALVFAMAGFQAIFVFIMAIVISIFRPLLLKEELDSRNVMLKFIALVLMVVGIVIINVS